MSSISGHCRDRVHQQLMARIIHRHIVQHGYPGRRPRGRRSEHRAPATNATQNPSIHLSPRQEEHGNCMELCYSQIRSSARMTEIRPNQQPHHVRFSDVQQKWLRFEPNKTAIQSFHRTRSNWNWSFCFLFIAKKHVSSDHPRIRDTPSWGSWRIAITLHLKPCSNRHFLLSLSGDSQLVSI